MCPPLTVLQTWPLQSDAGFCVAASLSLTSCQQIKMYVHVFFCFFFYQILIEKCCSHRTEGSPGSPTPAAFGKPLSASLCVARLIWSAEVRNETRFSVYPSSCFFLIAKTTFCYFRCVQTSAGLWISSRADCLKMCLFIPIFKQLWQPPQSLLW